MEDIESIQQEIKDIVSNSSNKLNGLFTTDIKNGKILSVAEIKALKNKIISNIGLLIDSHERLIGKSYVEIPTSEFVDHSSSECNCHLCKLISLYGQMLENQHLSREIAMINQVIFDSVHVFKNKNLSFDDIKGMPIEELNKRFKYALFLYENDYPFSRLANIFNVNAGKMLIILERLRSVDSKTSVATPA